MKEKLLSPVEKWQASFDNRPLEALDHLLIGRAYMGRLHRNDTDEIIFRLFHPAVKKNLVKLDDAMKNWFEKYRNSSPASISSSRWAEILRNAFSTVVRLNLDETRAWLLQNYQGMRPWLKPIC